MFLKFSNLSTLLNLSNFLLLLLLYPPNSLSFFTPRLSLLPYALSYSWVRKIVPVNIKAIKAYKGLRRVRDWPSIHLICPYFALFNTTAELALTNSAVIYFAYR